MENGFILIDKPAGMTSHDVVDVVRKRYGIKKVGHAGTLDPFATGLLIVGVGKATKKLGELSGLPKTYEATARLGATSTTFDIDGDIIEIQNSRHHMPTRMDIERALNHFRGGYKQKAPIFSAKKIKGKKLYELARKGQATEADRPSQFVEISELTIMEYQWPILRFRVTCGAGTYIRSLADDIGAALGCGAYLTELRRTSIGPYRIEDAVTLEKLIKLDKLPK